MNTPNPDQTESAAAGSSPSTCSALPRLYRGCWRPIKAGRLCRIRRLFKEQPIVECLGPLAGEANLRGDQFWRVRFADGTEREIARAHLSLKLVVEHFVRRPLSPNDPSSATRRTRALDCNRDALAGFAAAHG